MRHSTTRIASAGLLGVSLALPASLFAQGRGGGGPDNLPEVTFPVTIPPDDPKLAAMKKEAIRMIDSMSTFTQQMVDMVFSFGEPGFQEIETSAYLTGILEKNGFKVTRGVAGIPTAWTATWGSGKPVISLGSDIDDIPQASQKPGVGYKDPIVATAPGHGEGHNAGVPMNITAAIAVKKIMERDKIPGTIHLWPGVAEELMAGKMYFVRAGDDGIVVGDAGLLRGLRNVVDVRAERDHRLARTPARGPRRRDAGDAALDGEAVLLEDAGQVLRRLDLLETELAEAEDHVGHLLRHHAHAVDVGHDAALQHVETSGGRRLRTRRHGRLSGEEHAGQRGDGNEGNGSVHRVSRMSTSRSTKRHSGEARS